MAHMASVIESVRRGLSFLGLCITHTVGSLPTLLLDRERCRGEFQQYPPLTVAGFFSVQHCMYEFLSA
jgi:hypothetical protein